MRTNGLLCLVALAVAIPASTSSAQDEIVASFQRTETAPEIDGLGTDAVWADATVHTLDEFFELEGGDPNDGDEDMQVSWRALWDDTNLYVLVEIMDDEIVNDDSCNWEDDSVEFYIDAQNLDVDNFQPDGANPGTPAYQLTAIAGDNFEAFCGEIRIPEESTSAFSWGINSYDGGDPLEPEDDELTQYPRGTDTSVSQVLDDNNWTFEVAFPWESLEETPENIMAAGEMGFGIAINDDDLGGGRDTQWMWQTEAGDLWMRSDTFPSVELVGGDTGPQGDYNGNGELDSGDLDLQAQAMKDQDLGFDENMDGKVDIADRELWVNDLKNTWMGDADLNGVFDSSDFVIVFTAGTYETGAPALWAEGDWDGDMDFDSGDFVAAFGNGGYEMGERPGGPNPAAATVPEPSAIVLMLLGSLFLLRRRN